MIGRYQLLALGILVTIAFPGRVDAQTLTQADVNLVIGQTLAAAEKYKDKCVIAVSDREGFILGVYNASGAAMGINEFNAIDKAGTAAYLSSGGEAFTSRTAGYIIQPHFPPGIRNTAPGPLTGVGLSSLPFSDINHFRNPNPALQALGIPNTSLSGNPGGVPLYKSGVLVGAVGVDSSTTLSALVYVAGASLDEDVAVIGQSGFAPPAGILATQVLINGFRLPYTSFNGASVGVASLTTSTTANPIPPDGFDPAYPATASPGHPYNMTTPSPFPDIPGEVRNQIIGSTLPPVNNQPRLSQAEVLKILHQAAIRASQTRGAIRNPAGAPAAVFIVVVDYYNPSSPPGTTQGLVTMPQTQVPQVLGSFRTPDATLFSYDVAAQKARTALFFSNNTMAMSSRTIGFLAQGTYPPGIDGTAPGPYGPSNYGASNKNFVPDNPALPFFPPPYSLQTQFTLNPRDLKGITARTPPPDANPISANFQPNLFLPNGITVFPGGFPLYRNGMLIGAVGVSGDGVDQDDIISASATVGFEAPTTIRADQFTYRGARLPYAKFPQNASL